MVIDEMHVVWTDLTLRAGMYADWESNPNPDSNDLIPHTEEGLALDRHSTYICMQKWGKP